MEINSYFIALEAYVKHYVDIKAVETARERGTYDKSIMRFVIDFTYKSSPKKRWSVSKAELKEDMTAMVEIFANPSAIDVGGKALCYRNHYGELRVVFAPYADQVMYELSQLPKFVLSDLAPDMEYGFLDVKVGDGYAVAPDGSEIPFDNHPIDTIINVVDRVYTAENNL